MHGLFDFYVTSCMLQAEGVVTQDHLVWSSTAFWLPQKLHVHVIVKGRGVRLVWKSTCTHESA